MTGAGLFGLPGGGMTGIFPWLPGGGATSILGSTPAGGLITPSLLPSLSLSEPGGASGAIGRWSLSVDGVRSIFSGIVLNGSPGVGGGWGGEAACAKAASANASATAATATARSERKRPRAIPGLASAE